MSKKNRIRWLYWVVNLLAKRLLQVGLLLCYTVLFPGKPTKSFKIISGCLSDYYLKYKIKFYSVCKIVGK